jgi:hypothetical protein
MTLNRTLNSTMNRTLNRTMNRTLNRTLNGVLLFDGRKEEYLAVPLYTLVHRITWGNNIHSRELIWYPTPKLTLLIIQAFKCAIARIRGDLGYKATTKSVSR